MPRLNAAEIVENTWGVLQPTLDDPGDEVAYFHRSWCPADADDIDLNDRRFQRSPS